MNKEYEKTRNGVKKIVAIAFLLIFVSIFGALFVGCDGTGIGNKALMDVTYTYDRAIIQLVNGEIVDTKVKSWDDYDGEQLQIITEDGTVYLTSSFRCDLINTKEE